MDIDVSLDDGSAKKIEAVMRLAPQLLQPYLLDGMRRVGLELQRFVKTEQLSGQALQVRTGNLRRAIVTRVEATGSGDAMATIGVDLSKAPYGRVQDQGGTIRPKTATMLTIPVGAARTKSGVARFSARDLLANPGAFGYTGAFFRKNMLFGATSRGPVPLFALKPAVTIKGTGYLTRAPQEKRAWIVDEIGRAVSKGLKALFPNG